MTEWAVSLTLADRAILTAGRDMWSTWDLPDYGLPSVRVADGPMGITGGRVDERDIALLTPCGLALASSWDRDLVNRVGTVVGDEGLRMGIQGVLAPNLNLLRSPLAGRAFELFGEDPQLIAELGTAWALGVQSRGVASVIKHIVCNDSETDRRTMNSVVDETTLREVYFRPFEHSANSGAWAMLTAYNRVNGVPCAEATQVLSDWLKNDLGWDGLIMSDWFGTQSGRRSLNAGLDLEMPGPARHMGLKLLEENGGDALDLARLEDASLRLHRLAKRVETPLSYDASAKAEAQRCGVLEEAAAAGMVLLRNDLNALPLKSLAGKTIAVIGPNADVPCFQGGTFAKVAVSPNVVSPRNALTEVFTAAGAKVIHQVGVEPEHRIPPLSQFSPVTEDGLPGLDVTILSSEPGASAYHEVRTASSLIWFKDMPGVGDLLNLNGQANIRVATRFVAPKNGVYTMYAGGTGQVTLSVNDVVLVDFDGVALQGDIMGKLMQAPHGIATIELEEGQEVHLEYEMAIQRSLAHGIWFGCKPPQDPNSIQKAVEAALAADEVILLVGETADAGLESIDRDTTKLSAAQVNLIRKVCEANPRTVIVLNAAHQIDVADLKGAAAILLAWYPGQEFSNALAKVLTGELEPGGRLPMTFAQEESDYPVWSLRPDSQGDLRYHEGWWVGYRAFLADKKEPAYAFGHGLGYAEIELSNTSLHGSVSEGIEVEVTATNLSDRKGKAVVQVYVEQPVAEGARARISLQGFATVFLEGKTTQTLRVSVSSYAFKQWCAGNSRWELKEGTYQISVGKSSVDILSSHPLEIGASGT
ncbi:beta-glucosidase family protein [Pseudomonas sp. CIP-10]|uniref:beta-glucosidase family protein n=1 Tax=Pseudomonas sp. CIP-10 TaxID=2892442 RepID=UPI001E659C0E|nr:glycoside hydrolase family 3 C-terminal domain-containing protein [Pseudomonas sp. CIP-10]UFH30028.1 glycoside hydrolase family 3 C-terminal domain-containing protein [Pseudomonas sp. CIP-10]